MKKATVSAGAVGGTLARLTSAECQWARRCLPSIALQFLLNHLTPLLSLTLSLLFPPAFAADPTSQILTVGVRRNMAATRYTPDGPGLFPSVIVFHTSQGITEVDRSYCAGLAREGFICIVPAFLRAYGIKQDEC